MEKMDDEMVFIEMLYTKMKFVSNIEQLDKFIEKLVWEIYKYPQQNIKVKERIPFFVPKQISVIKIPNPIKHADNKDFYNALNQYRTKHKRNQHSMAIGYFISLKYIGFPKWFSGVFAVFEQRLMKKFPHFKFKVFYKEDFLQ